MINHDLTEIFKDYCEWDFVLRRKRITQAKKLIEEHRVVIYKEIEYRNFEDLKVDLDAECYQTADSDDLLE